MLVLILGLLLFIISFAFIVFVHSLDSQLVIDLDVSHGLGDLDGLFSQFKCERGCAQKLGFGVLVSDLQV